MLALLVGRPLTLNEYPDHLRELLDRARERFSTGRDRPLTASLRAWLERTLPLESRRPLATALEAQVALEEALKKDKSYAPGASALKHFVERVTPVLEQLATPTAPAAVPARASTSSRLSVVPEPRSEPAPSAATTRGKRPRRPTPEEEEADEIAFLEQELARLAAEETAATIAAEAAAPMLEAVAAPAAQAALVEAPAEPVAATIAPAADVVIRTPAPVLEFTLPVADEGEPFVELPLDVADEGVEIALHLAGEDCEPSAAGAPAEAPQIEVAAVELPLQQACGAPVVLDAAALVPEAASEPVSVQDAELARVLSKSPAVRTRTRQKSPRLKVVPREPAPLAVEEAKPAEACHATGPVMSLVPDIDAPIAQTHEQEPVTTAAANAPAFAVVVDATVLADGPAVEPGTPSAARSTFAVDEPGDLGPAVVEILYEVPRRLASSPVVEYAEFVDGSSVEINQGGEFEAAPVATDAVFEHAGGNSDLESERVEVDAQDADAWSLVAPEDGPAVVALAELAVDEAGPTLRDDLTLRLDFELMHESALLAADVESRRDAGLPASATAPASLLRDAANRAPAVLDRTLRPVAPLVEEEVSSRRRGRPSPRTDSAQRRRTRVGDRRVIPERSGAPSGALAAAQSGSTLAAAVASNAPRLALVPPRPRLVAVAAGQIAQHSAVRLEGCLALACAEDPAFAPAFVEFREPPCLGEVRVPDFPAEFQPAFVEFREPPCLGEVRVLAYPPEFQPAFVEFREPPCLGEVRVLEYPPEFQPAFVEFREPPCLGEVRVLEYPPEFQPAFVEFREPPCLGEVRVLAYPPEFQPAFVEFRKPPCLGEVRVLDFPAEFQPAFVEFQKPPCLGEVRVLDFPAEFAAADPQDAEVVASEPADVASLAVEEQVVQAPATARQRRSQSPEEELRALIESLTVRGYDPSRSVEATHDDAVEIDLDLDGHAPEAAVVAAPPEVVVDVAEEPSGVPAVTELATAAQAEPGAAELTIVGLAPAAPETEAADVIPAFTAAAPACDAQAVSDPEPEAIDASHSVAPESPAAVPVAEDSNRGSQVHEAPASTPPVSQPLEGLVESVQAAAEPGDAAEINPTLAELAAGATAISVVADVVAMNASGCGGCACRRSGVAAGCSIGSGS